MAVGDTRGAALLTLTPDYDRLASPGRAFSEFVFPAFASQAPDGGLVVIDSSLRRVVRLHADGRLAFRLEGGSRDPGRFFYAQEAVVDADGRLFLLNWVLDANGFFLEREEIQEYDARGRYVRTLHQVDLADPARGAYRMAMRPCSRALTPGPGRLRWLELQVDGLMAWHADLDPPSPGAGARRLPVRPERFFPLDDAHRIVAEARFLNDVALVGTLKDGRIARLEAKTPPRWIFDADASPRRTPDGVPPVPWGLAVGADGQVYFTDLASREIRRLAPDAAPDDDASEAVWSTGELIRNHAAYHHDIRLRGGDPRTVYFARLHASADGVLVAAAENTVAIMPGADPSRVRLVNGFPRGAGDRAWVLASWLGLALLGIGSVLWCVRCMSTGSGAASPGACCKPPA